MSYTSLLPGTLGLSTSFKSIAATRFGHVLNVQRSAPVQLLGLHIFKRLMAELSQYCRAHLQQMRPADKGLDLLMMRNVPCAARHCAQRRESSKST